MNAASVKRSIKIGVFVVRNALDSHIFWATWYRALKSTKSIHITRVCLMETKSSAKRRTNTILWIFVIVDVVVIVVAKIHQCGTLCQSALAIVSFTWLPTVFIIFEIFAANSNPFPVYEMMLTTIANTEKAFSYKIIVWDGNASKQHCCHQNLIKEFSCGACMSILQKCLP